MYTQTLIDKQENEELSFVTYLLITTVIRYNLLVWAKKKGTY